MRRYFYVWAAVFSLAMGWPFVSQAADLRLQTSDGYSFVIPYQVFFVDQSGNLTVQVGTKSSLPQDFGSWEPVISISGTTADNSTGIVTGTTASPLTFNVVATDSHGTPSLSCLYPAEGFSGSGNTGTFEKTYSLAGSYLAIFSSSITIGAETFTTQRVIKLNITTPGPTTYTLTTAVSPSGAGTVSGGGTYSPGANATIQATPNSGYVFSSWSGAVTGSANPTTVLMNGNKSVTANFTVNGGGGGGTGNGSGTLADPYKLNNPRAKGGYTHNFNTTGDFTIGANAKVYFEVDPKAYTGLSWNFFTMVVMGYNNPYLKFYYRVIDRAGNVIRPETQIPQTLALAHFLTEGKSGTALGYDIDNVRHIYLVENPGPSASIGVWWTN